MEENTKKNTLTAAYWVEKVVIITDNFEIKGDIYMPKTTKKSRLLSELLNSNRKFIAVKNCVMQTKTSGSMEPEILDFLEVNISSIVLIKPYIEEN